MRTGQFIPFDVWGQRGWCGTDVVGESHYIGHIRQLFGKQLPPYGHELTGVETFLRHDPTNKHDHNAVGVWINGGQVGNLAREDAARYVRVLARLQAEGFLARTTARVYGGWEEDDDYPSRAGKFIGSVRIDLPEPHLLVPANLAPAGLHWMLPRGDAIQVTGEEKHLAALLPYQRPEGECWAYVTLHDLVEKLARSERTVVEVRVDGERVGQLTPKMSGELLPAVTYCAESGATAVARAIIKGNRLKMEVVLYVARAHEIPESWFQEHHGAASTQARVQSGRAEPGAGAPSPRSAVAVPAGVNSAPPLPAAAWYPNPTGSGLRWWDGTQWTPHTHPGT